MTVRLEADGTASVAEVVYDLTALAPESEADFQKFADGYAAYLESWERDIAAYLSHARHASPEPHP